MLPVIENALLTTCDVGAARLGGSLRYDVLELRQRAVAAAKDADQVVICIGLLVSLREDLQLEFESE